MEADLEAIMAEARSVDSELAGGDTSDIVGLLVLDRAGLVVGQQGEVGAGLGGVVQTAVTQAARLETGEQPTIVINTENRKYLIKREENITTTIIKRI